MKYDLLSSTHILNGCELVGVDPVLGEVVAQLAEDDVGLGEGVESMQKKKCLAIIDRSKELINEKIIPACESEILLGQKSGVGWEEGLNHARPEIGMLIVCSNMHTATSTTDWTQP